MAQRQSLVGVQYVRAVAALCVAFYHCSIQVPALTPYFFKYLGMSLNYPAGVDVFFVVSGLIMYLTGRHLGPGDFLARRITRIVPLYWILTLLVSLVLFIRPELFRTTVVTGRYLLDSLFFIPYRNPAHGGDVMPILVPGWSLNMEMFFYLIFAGLLAVSARALLLGAALVFFALWFLHGMASRHGDLAAITFLTGDRNFEFLAGMAIGYLQTRGGFARSALAVLALLFGAVYVLLVQPSFVSNDEGEFLLTTLVPAALIVLAVGVFGAAFWHTENKIAGVLRRCLLFHLPEPHPDARRCAPHLGTSGPGATVGMAEVVCDLRHDCRVASLRGCLQIGRTSHHSDTEELASPVTRHRGDDMIFQAKSLDSDSRSEGRTRRLSAPFP